jgi:adenosylcobinamide kinase/adenosylcobinamide-phosphate guanylyltransferase
VSAIGSIILLVLGGARAGKSRFALRRAQTLGGDAVTFIATARRGDPDFDDRIARHRADRPAPWTTIESTDLAAAVAAAAPDTVVLVDCLTLWVAAALEDQVPLEQLWPEVESALRRRVRPVILVSNEVGTGVHPEQPVGLRFRDGLGWVNQQAAAAADEVAFMVAGLPIRLKSPG